MTSSFLRYQYPKIPQHMSIGASQYQFDLSHYPELKNRNIEKLASSYILKFTGFYSMNRQEGLGSEFVVVTEDASHFNNNFILDPEQYFQDKTNPNIHRARYLSVSATAEASDSQVSAEEILSGKMNFTIKLFNPYQYKNHTNSRQSLYLNSKLFRAFCHVAGRKQIRLNRLSKLNESH